MPDLSELYSMVSTAILADAQLVALLGGATEVYQERPSKQAKFPCITMRFRDNPLDMDAPGGYRPAWWLTIYGSNPDTLRAIQARLHAVLDIPRTVPTALSGAAYKITEMRQIDAQDGPVFSGTNAAEEIDTLVTVWNSLVLPLT